MTIKCPDCGYDLYPMKYRKCTNTLKCCSCEKQWSIFKEHWEADKQDKQKYLFNF